MPTMRLSRGRPSASATIVPATPVVLLGRMHALARRAVLADRLERCTGATGPRPCADATRSAFVGRYSEPEDREVAGWIASAFAYGQASRRSRPTSAACSTRSVRGPPGPSTGSATSGAFARERSRRLPPPLPRRARRGRAPLRDRPARAAGGVAARASSRARSFAPRNRTSAGLALPRVARIEAFDYRPALGAGGLPSGRPSRFFFPTRRRAPPANAGTSTCAGWCGGTASTSGSGRASRPTASSSRPTRTSTSSRGASV